MKLRSFLIPLVILAIAGCLLAFVILRWNTWRAGPDQVKTNDAYVHANIVPLSTRVTDKLRQVNVNDFQRVRAGELIAELDDTDYQAQLQEAESGLAETEAEKVSNQVQKRIQESKIDESVRQVDEAAQAERAAEATAGAAEADVVRADKERARQQALYADNATTRQTLEKAVDDDDRARMMLESARADRDKAAAALSAAHIGVKENQQGLTSIVSKDSQLDAEIREKIASIQAAKVQVDYTRIYAPVDGVVGERKVFPGQLVSPGMELISLVEGNIWVEANFEETQLANVSRGDRADVRIDALPGQVFRGRVLEISPASGSQASLFPPDNATGNFTKVVQRIPVKISLEADTDLLDRLRPGFSASVLVYPSGRGQQMSKSQAQ